LHVEIGFFLLLCFIFPTQTTKCYQQNLPFVFLSVTYVYAGRWHDILKETVLWGNITWTAMGKQNMQAAKKVLTIKNS